MRHKRWIPLALFLGAALISAWLSPALSPGWAASALPAAGPPAVYAQAGEASVAPSAYLEAEATPGEVAVLQAAISLLLMEEDSQVFLPLLQH